jgi:hypothetical protein
MITPVFKNDKLTGLPKEANMAASRKLKLLHLTILLLGAFCLLHDGSANASTLVPQTWLPGECIPQFATPLPVFGPGYNAALPRVDALKNPFLTVTMKETERQVLPIFIPGAGCPAVTIQPTRVWAYETSNTITKKVLGPAFWPAVTLETRRLIPTVVTYVNQLPSWDPTNTSTSSFGPGGFVQGLVTVDQSIHWANPLGNTGAMNCDTLTGECLDPYTGPVPAVVHLHGGEVPSSFDGGPDAWFNPRL